MSLPLLWNNLDTWLCPCRCQNRKYDLTFTTSRLPMSVKLLMTFTTYHYTGTPFLGCESNISIDDDIVTMYV